MVSGWRGALAALALLTACAAPTSGSASVVLLGGRVWTGVPGAADAAAIAVHGDVVTCVGSDAEVRAHIGPATRVIALDGRRVTPGFIDAHVHFLWGGDEILAPDLRSARSEEEFAARLGAFARTQPVGTWITSGTWDHENWPGGSLPTAAVLDRHVPDHPVFVSRLDGHMAVANSRAIQLAGVRAETPDPPGGTIVRDPATGAPQGVFKDSAMLLVNRRVPAWSREQRLARARAALAHAASLGVTSAHDMLDNWAPLETFQELHAAGELTCRLTLYTPVADYERWRAVRVRGGFGDAWLKLAGVKAFADGSLGSTTALFLEPYADAPDTSGLATTELEAGGLLEEQVRGCAEAGLQPAVHAIGDRANRLVLDTYERTRALGVAFSPRIEHAQHIHPNDLPRFVALGVIASMQPYHAIDDGRWAEKRIGAVRCQTTYAFRSLLASGATVAFGSDWPVAPLDPLLGVYAAVTRATLDGAQPDGFVPQEKVSVAQALTAYTRGAARASGDEGRLGELAAGMLADLVILDTDVLSIAPSAIRDARVALTMVGGRVVYERKP